jgi:hypothetical protein
MRWSIWIGLLGFLLGVSAQAASFDCAKAQSKVEKMICADVELSSLDEALALAYSAASRLSDNPLVLQTAQKQWLKQRDQCSNIACVKTLYITRITALPLKQAFTVLKDDITPNYPPLNNFCQTMADNLNSMSSWPPAYCERPLNPAFPNLTLPQWREWEVEEFDKRWHLLEQAINHENSKIASRKDERWTDADTQRWREGVRTKEAIIEETILPENTISDFESRRLLRINSVRSHLSLESFKQYYQEKYGQPLDISKYPDSCVPGLLIQLTDDGLAVNNNARALSSTATQSQLWLYEYEPGKYELFDQFWMGATLGFRAAILTHASEMCKIFYVNKNQIQGAKK